MPKLYPYRLYKTGVTSDTTLEFQMKHTPERKKIHGSQSQSNLKPFQLLITLLKIVKATETCLIAPEKIDILMHLRLFGCRVFYLEPKVNDFLVSSKQEQFCRCKTLFTINYFYLFQ